VAYRLALATLAATCVLILLGGLVTNTGAALAVPDWPSTFGYNMILFPWSQMVGGVLYEHSHRLMGALVGLLTLALAAALWREGGRLRRLGLIAVAAVVAQGVLGGLRVVLLKDTLAIFHGCLAQAFFALLAVIALMTAPRGRAAAPPVEPALRGLAVLAAVLVYAQIVFGALLTHAGRIDMHLAGALLVFVFVPIVAAQLRRTGDTVAAPVSRVVTVLLGIQLLLGVGSFLVRFSPIWIPGEQLTVTVLPVAHRLVGSLILAATVILAVRVSVVAGAVSPARTEGGLTQMRRGSAAPGQPDRRGFAAPDRPDRRGSAVPDQPDRRGSAAPDQPDRRGAAASGQPDAVGTFQ
jgi:heme a synthase